MANRANFKINPANALGIDADETRAKLISLALSKPESYYKLREIAIQAITRKLAIETYDLYWDILTSGVIPFTAESRPNGIGGVVRVPDIDGVARNKTQLIYPDVAASPYQGLAFNPNLPEKEVNIICSKISDQIKQIGRSVIEEIMPMNHLEMAQKKQVDILKAKGI
jgi:hypothetical protein